ncbi:beta-glucosidase [Heyndrickxia shackletonii]|uniref:Beta-glucosidase n=1 Tax=Heyndrickxia shackletonii TaxID=157838 RepID=A0A0Q3X082_9BACI|nr:GH1 family beta-glucosidase [Heyndrickxia shackletonii]KQL55229.1 beta-glucosidase [Heyndrickxia shackletonii]NEY98753.1 beta-glucosidase [Heyndrickxia shackletonii]
MEIFPDTFTWGTATASYQIEGGAHEEGRGESIWDRFARQPGKVYKQQNGEIACDHFHRYPEDVELMADLGISSYRFSFAWPRLFPEEGKFNSEGLAFYTRLLDELDAKGITPAATIYHWDLPTWLQDKGGWTNRETVDQFVTYAKTLFDAFGSRIPSWITHNEPWCAAFLGYAFGVHAPGHTDWNEALIASHHLLLSHGKVVELYRSMGLAGEIGITLNLSPTIPASEAAEDVAAAERSDGFANRWFLDPIFKGRYPEDMVTLYKNRFGPLSFMKEGDLDTISAPIDFLGINYYSHNIVENDEKNDILGAGVISETENVTDMGWGIHPESLYDLLTRIKSDYTDIPLYITENGAAFPDVWKDGKIEDHARIKYLHDHFAAAHRFIEEGGNLQGYYVWSLMDNYEWSFGYSKRFGIIYVDYETLERTPKESYKWYQKVIKENGIE